MNLSAFIRRREEAIIRNWEDFAKEYIPPAENLNLEKLRDHVKEILSFIASDLETAQTESQQISKSKGESDTRSAAQDTAAQSHADERFAEGFEANHIIAEFRALRASVINLWERERSHTDADFAEMIRFNESIDQVLTEGFSRYTEKQSHARTLFLGTLIHDLRNPLAAVSQSAHLLKMMGEMNEKQSRLVDQISASTARTVQLVANLIDTIRVRLGKGVPIKPIPMDMKTAVEQAADEARAAHPGLRIEIETRGALRGQWDNGRIGQVLSNLIGNAAQYGKEDGAIKITAKENSGEVLLSVHNEGEPIPLSALPSIFDPLTRQAEEDGETYPSTNLGLGLFITREIVEAHGGKIDVSSSEDEGTTFSVTLPHAVSATASVPA